MISESKKSPQLQVILWSDSDRSPALRWQHDKKVNWSLGVFCWDFVGLVDIMDATNKYMESGFCHRHVHPWRLTWNIIMEVWKIIFLSKWVIFRFHVYLPGCNWSRGLFESYCCCKSSFRLRLSSHFQKQTIWSSHDTGWSVKNCLPSKNIYHEPPKPWKIKVLAT